jgi:two-component sensor histidine kinase
MTATGVQPAYESTTATAADGRSPLAHLLHALNQPLTGLQCSLELGLIGSRTAEQYVRTLRDGVELTARMRVLVEAIRELAETEQEVSEEREMIGLDSLLRETAEELRPVAEMRNIRVQLRIEAAVSAKASRRRLGGVVFRFLESALSLAAPDSIFRIHSGTERGQGWLALAWNESKAVPEHSPFSRQELGLLIARAGWNRIGADWEAESSESSQLIRVVLPVVEGGKDSTKASRGEVK